MTKSIEPRNMKLNDGLAAQSRSSGQILHYGLMRKVLHSFQAVLKNTCCMKQKIPDLGKFPYKCFQSCLMCYFSALETYRHL